jgi:hypothetical protein
MFFLVVPALIILAIIGLAYLLEVLGVDGGTGRKSGAAEEVLDPAIITYDDITGMRPYFEKSGIPNSHQHIGQRKLFLNELQFITRQCGLSEPALVIYAGGAPSNKAAFLAELCPNVMFLLVDPNPFVIFPPTRWNKSSPYGANPNNPRTIIAGTDKDGLTPAKILEGLQPIKQKYDELVRRGRGKDLYDVAEDPRERIMLFNTIYTLEHSIALRKVFPTDKIYFLSDIRTSINNDIHPEEVDIVWNITQQYIWSATLGAAATMLKWRHPFYRDESVDRMAGFMMDDFKVAAAGLFVDSTGAEHRFPPIDFVANFRTKTIQYPTGETYIQPWCGRTSTETRLVFKRDAPIVTYPTPEEYDGRLFWYNTIGRYGPRKNLAIPPNPTPKTAREIADMHIDHCNDCAIESHVWGEYIAGVHRMLPKQPTGPAEIRRLISRLISATGGRTLHPPQKQLEKILEAKHKARADKVAALKK